MIEDYEIFYLVLSVSIFLSINFLFVINFIKNENIKFISTFFIIILLLLITGFRGEHIGLDTVSYVSLFNGTYSLKTIP